MFRYYMPFLQTRSYLTHHILYSPPNHTKSRRLELNWVIQ